jgi:hypothetical protein
MFALSDLCVEEVVVLQYNSNLLRRMKEGRVIQGT